VYSFDHINRELRKTVKDNIDVKDSRAYTRWYYTARVIGETYDTHLTINVYLPEYKFTSTDEMDNYYRQLECHENQHVNIAKSMLRSIKTALEDLIAQNGAISVDIADKLSEDMYDSYVAIEQDFDEKTDHGCQNDRYMYSSCNIACSYIPSSQPAERYRRPASASASKGIEPRLRELNLVINQLYGAIGGKTLSQGGLNKKDLQDILNMPHTTLSRPKLIDKIKKRYSLSY